MDSIPLWLLFVLTTLLILLAIEGGYTLGKHARRKSADEKESPVGAIVGTVLALLAFILAFTFGMVSDRYDARKELVRDQASAIRTAYARADILPDAQRAEARQLYNDYLALVIKASTFDSSDSLPTMVSEAQSIQQKLWDQGMAYVKGGDNSDVSAMYLESINDLSNILANRISVSIESRIPDGIWIVLYALVVLGMAAVGYQTAIAESRRTWAMLMLALSFSIVFIVIAALDDPERGYLPVSQKPLTSLQTQLETTPQP